MNQATRELKSIGRLQRQLLPRELPRVDGWDFAFHSEAGGSGGGDYYDVLPMSEGRVGVIIADVSGHGPAAAVLTAMIRMLLHSCPLTSSKSRDPFCSIQTSCHRTPDVILTHLNHVLVENSLEEQFVTMIFGVLNPQSGEFQFSNAGHPLPNWWHASSGELTTLTNLAGLPLGVDADSPYESATIQLAIGDALVLYTDGVTESQNRAGAMFGQQNLAAGIAASANGGADEIKDAVIQRIERFREGLHALDDLTLLVLKRKVSSSEASQ